MPKYSFTIQKPASLTCDRHVPPQQSASTIISGVYPGIDFTSGATIPAAVMMATVAFAVMLPSNLQVLFEMRKAQPNVALIGSLTSRYATFAAVLGVMQIGTIVVMSRLATF